MKKCYILLFALLVCHCTYAQVWTNLATGTTVPLKSTCFPTPNIGYSVGQNATILKTTNGGQTWISLNTGLPIYGTLLSVCFIDANIGYVVGYANVILKTTDGGTTWTSQNSGIFDNFTAVYFRDANNGYITGSSGTLSSPCEILKTTNGGTTWTTQLSSTGWFTSLFFTTANIGYALGNKCYKTTDGGTNWTIVSSQGGDDVFFTSTNTGYIVDGFDIYKSTDGGNNWILQSSGASTYLSSVCFVNTNTGYVVGDQGTILKTTDGGNNWAPMSSPTSQNLSSVYFFNENTGYCAGDQGTALRYGFGVGMDESSSRTGIFKIFPNPANDKINIETFNSPKDSRLSVFNAAGQLQIETQLINNKIQIDINSLSKGLYFVKVTNQNSFEVQVFVKE